MIEGTTINSRPQDTGLVGAVEWIAETMTGPAASVIATLAVALLGFAMLQGKVSIRGATRTVLGCFILFGAPQIARELLRLPIRQAPVAASIPAAIEQMPIIPTLPQPNPDPYSGASVPMP